MMSRSQRILGLDIGSYSVKAVELTRTGERFSITGYGQTEINSAGTLKDAIVAVLREGRFKSKQVASSVSGRSVIVRYINTPFMKAEDLKASMRFEADKYIPFEVSEVILDCVPLDAKPTETGEMRVVLVAVKKDVVNEHVRLLQEAGLYPCIVDVDCFALGNSFELASQLGGESVALESVTPQAASAAPRAQEAAGEEPAGKESAADEDVGPAAAQAKAEPDQEVEGSAADMPQAESAPGPPPVPAAAPVPQAPRGTVFALVDIGSQKTNINIVEGANSYFTREVYIGGEDMTEAVTKHLGIPPAEAETVKRNGSREVEVLEAVAQTLDDLANEIFLSFDYFENQFDREIKIVYLSGGGARLKGIQGALAQTLAREVRMWDPIAGYDVSLGQQQEARLRENAPQLAVALGLASRLRKV